MAASSTLAWEKRMPTAGRLVPILVLAVAACGCGGSPPPTAAEVDEEESWDDDGWGDEAEAGSEGAPRASAIEAIGISGPDVPWADMSADDREMYMVGKVLPIMHELFARHDAERFGTYGCESCHGAEMRELAFRMPPGSSFAVPAEGTPAWTGMERTFPEMVRFMRDEVTPTMGTLLGADGFTCHGCHPAR